MFVEYRNNSLLRSLRKSELAGYLLDFSNNEDVTSRENRTNKGSFENLELKEQRINKLLSSFEEALEYVFKEEIKIKLDLIIKNFLLEEKNKKFIIPNKGIIYIDVDPKLVAPSGTLIINFNVLAGLIKEMVAILQLESIKINNSFDAAITKNEMDFFGLFIQISYDYFYKNLKKEYIRLGFEPEMLQDIGVGIYIEDPNFWIIKPESGIVLYSIYQELVLAYDLILIKELHPNKIDLVFERIAKLLKIKSERYSFINDLALDLNNLNDLAAHSSNINENLFGLKTWVAIKEIFGKENESEQNNEILDIINMDITKFYLDLEKIPLTLESYFAKIYGVSDQLQKAKLSSKTSSDVIFKATLDSTYLDLAKKYKIFLDDLNQFPEDYTSAKLKLKKLQLVETLSGSDLLKDEIKELNDYINNYSFEKFDFGLFTFGKFLEKTININDNEKKYFKDPNSKNKDSKMIEEAIKNFDRLYRNRIIGQDHIIEPLWSVLKKWYIGIRSKRPVGSFLLCGPTGVGKTETAKFLSEELGAFDNLITLDMSEYQSEIDKTKIIGVAPGYAGYDQGAGVLNKVAENPRSVILFDEIEKAHPLIFDLLLQLLDEGRLTDHKGIEVSFKECLIICTTNAHYGDIEHIGTSNRSDIINILSLSFRKEFLARFTDILKFNNLSTEVMELIFDKKLAEEIKEISESSQFEIIIIEDENYYQKKVKLVGGMDHSLGARELGRLINEEIIAPLIQLIIDLGSEIEGKKFYFDTLGKLKYK